MTKARYIAMLLEYYREFDGYINKLKNLSDRASTYLLHNAEVKSIYRENIRKSIEYLRGEFYKKRDFLGDQHQYQNNKSNIFNGLIYLYEGEESTYQKARRNDWSIYELTSWFEERGVLFYGEKSLKIFGGVIQIAGGYIVFRTGKIVKSSSLKGIGALAMATGTSNTLELSSEIVYRITEGKYGGENQNILENSMADIYEYAGYDRRHGELTYKTIDFSVSMFLSFGALVKLNNPQRIFNLPVKTNGKMIYPSLIDRVLNPKGSFFLSSAIRSDFTFKINQMSKPAFLYNSGMSVNKAKILISEYKKE